MIKYKCYDYDVWGNRKDGFEVNNIFETCETYELNHNWNDRGILQSLKRQGCIKRNIRISDVEIDGEMEYTLYFSYRGRPEFELRREK